MEVTVGLGLLVLAAIVVGALLQRVSGTGMGLVLAPMLTLLVGPGPGVLLTNATTFVSALLLTIVMRRHVDWRRALLIGAFAVPGAVVGALLVRAAPVAWLEVVVGASVVLALLLTVALAKVGRLPHVRAPWVTPSAGLLGGALNTLAGVSAPVMVVHARLVRWSQEGFAATMQPVFMTMGGLSVLAKTMLSSVDAAMPPPWLLVGMAVCVVAGIALGSWLSTRVSSQAASRTAMTLAGLGGLAALVRGALTLAG